MAGGTIHADPDHSLTRSLEASSACFFFFASTAKAESEAEVGGRDSNAERVRRILQEQEARETARLERKHKQVPGRGEKEERGVFLMTLDY
jgi:hypothetical protein